MSPPPPNTPTQGMRSQQQQQQQQPAPNLLSKPPDLSSVLPRLEPRTSRHPHARTTVTDGTKRTVSPPPPTPPLAPPPLRSTLRFERPSRRILSPHDHALFLSSPTYTLLTSFVFSLSDAVRGRPLSSVAKCAAATGNEGVKGVLKLLDRTENVVREFPAEETGGSRFGNRAFRDYVGAVEARVEGLMEKLGVGVGLDDGAEARKEVGRYFVGSLGERSRIDYGSGHELNFLVFLLCLWRLGLFLPESERSEITWNGAHMDSTTKDIFGALALVVFPRYLRLARTLQSTYYLEPAGSHGVWGLDDFQFFPFLVGASQLVGHDVVTPKSIHSPLTLEEYGPEYLYLEQISWVNKTKNVEGLRWHSPMLDDISAAKSWAKIEGGMRKMFVKEVLGKLPVMQHFLFGGLVPAVEGMSTEGQVEEGIGAEGEGSEEDGHVGHSHGENSWGDCCGIKVPSGVGAAMEARKRAGEGLRRIPFD
ncbi:hypothetical protein BDY21DRAFT_330892 [Lineolata rhizophorae]|uniref:Serine/threonine-protein phosphatase 2A activator n=1 Tax=Lineolata rhizophorae TaxID=578093 RepID=A0A6A6PEU5_9PEZI|nr:hypothetical protein BDY21DRAFT_330892 [Lineolata rhizophorae]